MITDLSPETFLKSVESTSNNYQDAVLPILDAIDPLKQQERGTAMSLLNAKQVQADLSIPAAQRTEQNAVIQQQETDAERALREKYTYIDENGNKQLDLEAYQSELLPVNPNTGTAFAQDQAKLNQAESTIEHTKAQTDETQQRADIARAEVNIDHALRWKALVEAHPELMSEYKKWAISIADEKGKAFVEQIPDTYNPNDPQSVAAFKASFDGITMRKNALEQAKMAWHNRQADQKDISLGQSAEKLRQGWYAQAQKGFVWDKVSGQWVPNPAAAATLIQSAQNGEFGQLDANHMPSQSNPSVTQPSPVEVQSNTATGSVPASAPSTSGGEAIVPAIQPPMIGVDGKSIAQSASVVQPAAARPAPAPLKNVQGRAPAEQYKMHQKRVEAYNTAAQASLNSNSLIEDALTQIENGAYTGGGAGLLTSFLSKLPTKILPDEQLKNLASTQVLDKNTSALILSGLKSTFAGTGKILEKEFERLEKTGADKRLTVDAIKHLFTTIAKQNQRNIKDAESSSDYFRDHQSLTGWKSESQKEQEANPLPRVSKLLEQQAAPTQESPKTGNPRVDRLRASLATPAKGKTVIGYGIAKDGSGRTAVKYSDGTFDYAK